ncbi:MAG: DNA-binding protein [Methylibium sp.]|nr:DNA-binding protein [Methylibium sp.]
MPKAAGSVDSLPSSVQVSLEVLGNHLRLGRKRRKESLRSWALRMDVSVPTLSAMEKGDPRVSMGVYATALWLMGRDHALRELAAPENDAQALAQEMLVIQNAGKRRHG